MQPNLFSQFRHSIYPTLCVIATINRRGGGEHLVLVRYRGSKSNCRIEITLLGWNVI